MTYPRLVTRAGDVVDGAQQIPPTGLLLHLELDPALGEQQELVSASLVITCPAQETDLLAESLETVVTTDRGPLTSTTPAIQWLTVDWGSRRALTRLHVTTGTASNRTAMIKVADGGAWFPPYPADTLTLNSEKRMPAVIATRAMVEMVESTPYTVKVTEVAASAGNQLQNVRLAIGAARPFFEHPGPLLPGQTITIGDELVQAVNAALALDSGSTMVPLNLYTSVQGEIQITFAATVAVVKTILDGEAPAATLPLLWEGESVRTVTIAPNSSLREVSLSLAANPVTERAFLLPTDRDATVASLCAPGYTAAQGFRPLADEQPLVGVDLRIRRMSEVFSGTLTLYPDSLGRPGHEPIPGGAVEVRLDTPLTNGSAQWLSCSLPAPLAVSSGPWWAVLAVTAGEALWLLSEDAPEAATDTAYRMGSEAWTPRRLTNRSDSPWAITRLRIAAPERLPQVMVWARRGEAERQPLTLDASRAELDQAALATLNAAGPKQSGRIEIAVTSDVAGDVVLSDPRIRFML